MWKRLLVSSAILLVAASSLWAQPKAIERPPGFAKLIGPATFDPTMLREAIAFPISHTSINMGINNGEKTEELPKVAEIEKKLVGDERDAEWLMKLGDALQRAKSDRAKEAYEKSAAAYRKRIEKEPRVAKHYADITDPLWELKKHEERFFRARKCVELDPKNANGWWALRDCYWHEFNELVYPDGENANWLLSSDKPAPEIVRPLTDAEKEKARVLLKYIRQCHAQWKRFAPDDLDNMANDLNFQPLCDLFDNFFQTGKWDLEKSGFTEGLHSKKLREKLLQFGREKHDPAAIGYAITLQIGEYAAEARKSLVPLNGFTSDQKKAIGALAEILGKQSDEMDPKVAVKACVILAAVSMTLDDSQTCRKFAAKALKLAPNENAVINLVMMTQKKEGHREFDLFWKNHLRDHPSTRVWTGIASVHFRDKKYEETSRCLREGEKLDPKNRTLQLCKVALALRSGEAGMAEATKLLNALEKRLDEPAVKDAIFGATERPSFQDSYRYLRAVHTALSGKWEQGRDELIALRERDVLTEEITAALEAFPRRPTVHPLELKREK